MSSDPANNNPGPPQTPEKTAESTPPPPPKKGRRWLKVTLALVTVLLLLVLLAPTIASTGFVRNIILAQINAQLNGKLDIADWSLGWFSGASARGIKLTDASGAPCVSASSAQTNLTLASALFGNLNLGEVTVSDADFLLKFNPDGSTNFTNLAKSDPNAPPARIPALSINLTLTGHGSLQRESAPPIAINSLKLSAKVTDINQPIEHTLTAECKLGDSPAGSFSASGKIDLIDNNLVAADKLSLDETLSFSNVELAAVRHILPPSPALDKLSGIGAAYIAFSMKDGKQAAVEGKITSADVTAGVAAIDSSGKEVIQLYRSPEVTIVIPKSMITMPDGLSKWQTAHVKVGDSSTRLRIVANGSSITAHIDASLQSLLNALANQNPGAPGLIETNVELDIPTLAASLPVTLHIQPGTKVDSGKFTSTSKITLSPDKLDLTQSASLKSLHALRDGKPISLQDISLDLSASSLGGAGPIPDLRNIKLLLNSAFTTADFKGDSLANLSGSATGQLDKLTSELGQLFDLSALQLTGQYQLTLASSGDLPSSDKPTRQTFNLTLTTRNLTLLNKSTADSPLKPSALRDLNLSANLAGQLETAPTATTLRLSNLDISDPTNLLSIKKSPNQDFVLSIPKNALPAGSAQIEIHADLKRFVDIARDFGFSLNLQLADGTPVTLSTGALAASLRMNRDASGSTSLDGSTIKLSSLTLDDAGKGQSVVKDDELSVNLTGVNISADQKQLTGKSITLTGTLFSANLTDLDLRISSGNDPLDLLQRASLELNLTDLRKLQQVANPFLAVQQPAGKPAKPKPGELAELPPPTLTNGSLKLLANLQRQGKQTKLTLTELSGDKLAFRRGPGGFQAKPFKLSGEVLLTSPANSPGLQEIRVNSLSGNAILADINLPQPLVATYSNNILNLSGQIDATGPIGPLMRFLAAMQGIKRDEALPYRGSFALHPKLSSQNGIITLQGDALIDKLAMEVADKKPLTIDDAVPLLYNFVLNPAAQSLDIQQLSVQIQKGQAFALDVKGKVTGYSVKPTFDNVRALVSYDADQLLPILKPLLGESMRELRAKGALKNEQYTITGAFPLDQPFNQAITSLNINGGAALTLLEVNGLKLEKINTKLSLAKGVASLTSPNPVSCNGGTIRLDGIQLDLAAPSPTLSMPKGQLVKGIELNPTLAETFLGSASYLFHKMSEARGPLDVTVVQFDRVPLEWLAIGDETTAKNHKPAPGGRGELLLHIDEAKLGSGVLFTAFRALGANIPTVDASIKDGKIILENGQVKSDLALNFDGTVLPVSARMSLPENKIITGEMIIPKALTSLPLDLKVPVSGKVTAPQPDLQSLAQRNLSPDLLGNLVKQVAGGGKSSKNTGGKTPGVGDLIDLVGGNKPKDPDIKNTPDKPDKPVKPSRNPADPRPSPETTTPKPDPKIARPTPKPDPKPEQKVARPAADTPRTPATRPAKDPATKPVRKEATNPPPLTPTPTPTPPTTRPATKPANRPATRPAASPARSR